MKIHLAVDGSNPTSHIRVAGWLDWENIAIYSCNVMVPKVKIHRKLKLCAMHVNKHKPSTRRRKINLKCKEWELNPRSSVCKADVITLHHPYARCRCLAKFKHIVTQTILNHSAMLGMPAPQHVVSESKIVTMNVRQKSDCANVTQFTQNFLMHKFRATITVVGVHVFMKSYCMVLSTHGHVVIKIYV